MAAEEEMTTLGIVISTPGRRSLARTLQSIHYQRGSVEDVLVVGDGFHGPSKELCAVFADLGLPVRYQATEQTRDWGHSQVNYGFAHVKGDYVTYQDDDDIYLPRALEEMSRLASELESPRPILGRVKTPNHGLLWQSTGQTAVLDGHCLVAPNDKLRLGWMDSTYNGDQCLIHTTIRNYKELAWTDRVWTLTRPHWTLMPWCQYGSEQVGWWEWIFNPVGEVVTPPRATLKMEKVLDGDRMIAMLSQYAPDITHDELREIAQFAVYAAQGNDVRFAFDPGSPIEHALIDENYAEHYTTEYAHDWPPDFWFPVPSFTHIMNEAGEPIDDWRSDVWGGRPVR
jgi:glycosyltransferase involved in cell wall biosynthesis